MNRETKTITTPAGSTVEIYTYLTGKEAKEIQKSVFKHAKISVENGTAEKPSFDASAMIDAEEVALKLLIVSVNGDKTNASEVVGDMKVVDYNFVVKEINEITKDVFNTDFLAK
jgi:hypothetical protein